MGRARENDAFRLAFTRLLVEHYPRLVELAWDQLPTLVPHQAVAEAMRLVDIAPVSADPSSGEDGRAEASVDWLWDAAVQAIGFLGTSPAEANRIAAKGPEWRAEHDERLELVAALAGLGERCLPALLTLLGWPDGDVVAALADADPPVTLSIEGYRAFARQGIERLGEHFAVNLTGEGEERLGGLRYQLLALAPPLVWHPEAEYVLLGEEFEAELADLLTLTDLPALEASPDEVRDPSVDSDAPAEGDALLPEGAHAGVGLVASGADAEPAGEVVQGPGAWSPEDLVPLDASTGVVERPSTPARPTRRRAPVRREGRRVLAGAGAASLVAIVAVVVVAVSGPRAPADSPRDPAASIATPKAPTATTPRPPRKKQTRAAAPGGAPARKAAPSGRRQSVRVAQPVPVSASRPRPPSEAEIQAEFRP